MAGFRIQVPIEPFDVRSKDVAAPPAVAEELHQQIPRSRYVLIENGTHYTPLEYPEALNRALEEFFRGVFAEEWG